MEKRKTEWKPFLIEFYNVHRKRNETKRKLKASLNQWIINYHAVFTFFHAKVIRLRQHKGYIAESEMILIFYG